jgi:methyl-accepting chemotaxis protein
MTTGSESRLDRIESILAATASGLAETRAIVESNARAIEANSNRMAEVTAAIDSLREVVLNFVDGIQVINQRIDGHDDRFTEIVGQVRDLQVQNSRILDRLEGLEGQGRQG